MARYIAKNIVTAGIADKCTIQLAYAIGVKQPVSIFAETEGGMNLPNKKLLDIIKKNFELTPAGMMEMLKLRRPIYRRTAAYGHFGRNEPDFTWEKTDKAKDLLKEI
jgi:S-adenosylmethionine synthetase